MVSSSSLVSEVDITESILPSEYKHGKYKDLIHDCPNIHKIHTAYTF